MTKLPPPPPPIGDQPTVEPDLNVSADEVNGTAALLRVAGIAVELADSTGDARVKRIAEQCIKEVSGSGAVRDMLKVLVNQSAAPTGPSKMEMQREEERHRRNAEFQQSLMQSQANRQEQRDAQNKLANILLERLAGSVTPGQSSAVHSPDEVAGTQ
jgi:recombinational DNA repair protein (RecF pathway)